MYPVETPKPIVKTNMEHHISAAEFHEEAAESHRQAAALYAYGDYDQSNHHAQLARGYGRQAEESCQLAME